VEAFLSVRLGLRSRSYSRLAEAFGEAQVGEGGSFSEGGSEGGMLEPV